jgi:hypothetical protein
MNWYSKFKKVSVALAIMGLIGLCSPPTLAAQPSNASGAQLSTVGEQALADVTTCLTSGKSPVLDVFYLIDDSGSLRYTDANNVRQKVLKSSVSQLQNFVDQGVSVNFAESLFASYVTPVSPWRSLRKASDITTATQTIEQSVSNSNLRGNTDWEAGLRAAYNAFNERPSTSCKMLIWLTDGGINPTGNYVDTLDSLRRLCQTGLSANSMGSTNKEYGLFSQLRSEGVSIFGILYQNDASTLAQFKKDFSDGSSQIQGDQRLQLEHYLMSYMTPLVEGSGTVPTSAIASSKGLPPGGVLQCSDLGANGMAPVGLANGAFLNAKDPVQLSFQFLKLQNTIGGGSGSLIKDGHFSVPTGTADVKVITTSTTWQLTGPESSKVSASSSSASTSKFVRTSINSGVTQIEIPVKDNPNFLGEWKFKASGVDSEVFLFSGLTLSLDRDAQSQIIADRPNTLTGQVVRTAGLSGLAIDLARYPQHELSLQTLASDGTLKNISNVKVGLTDAGQFKIENYVPESNSTHVANLWIHLNLGADFQSVSSEFAVSLVDAKSLPVPTSDSVVMTDLVGPKGVAAGTIQVVGPTLSESSQFCLDASAIRTSDSQTSSQKIDRLSDFSWTFDGHDPAGGYCVTVAKGESRAIKVEAMNPHQANSHVVQIRGYTGSTENAHLSQTIQFEFNSQAQVDQIAKWGSVLLLLLLGIVGPLLGLYGFNKATTKFLPTSGLVRADYPVTIEPGATTKLTDARQATKGAAITVQPNDFKPIAASSKGEKQLPLSSAGTARAVVNFWPPLTAPWFEIAAPAGTRVISAFRGSTRNPAQFGSGESQEISPNIGDNWAVVIPESELAKPSTEPIKATLIVFAAMSPTLSQYQSRVSGLERNPSIARTLLSIRESYAEQQKIQAIGKQKSHRGKDGGPEGPSSPSAPSTSPKAPQGFSSGGLSAPPGSSNAGRSVTPPSGGLKPPPSSPNTVGGLKPPPSSNT